MTMRELEQDEIMQWCSEYGHALFDSDEMRKLESIRPKIELFLAGKAGKEILEGAVSILKELGL